MYIRGVWNMRRSSTRHYKYNILCGWGVWYYYQDTPKKKKKKKYMYIYIVKIFRRS